MFEKKCHLVLVAVWQKIALNVVPPPLPLFSYELENCYTLGLKGQLLVEDGLTIY